MPLNQPTTEHSPRFAVSEDGDSLQCHYSRHLKRVTRECAVRGLDRAAVNRRTAYSPRPLMGRGNRTRAYFLLASNFAAFFAAAKVSAWPPMSLPALVTASTPEPEVGDSATTANHAPSDPS